MAAGLGEAASAISIVSLTIQLFDGCIKGFVLLSAAQDLGSRAEVLMCRLEWEHYCLNRWATAVGLFGDPPMLNVSASQIDIVQKTLSTLGKILNDASKLKEDYGLDVAVTDQEIVEVNASRRPFGRILGKNKPNFEDDTAKVYSRRNNVWKKLRWASVDAEKLRLLLKDVGYFNNKLQSHLHPTDQGTVEKDDHGVMRAIVAQTFDRVLLDAMAEPSIALDGALAAAARLRHQGILLGLVDSAPLSSSNSSSTTTLVPAAKPSSPRAQPSAPSVGAAKGLRRDWALVSGCRGNVDAAVNREIAYYDGEPIVVEWKDVESNLESKLKYRVANVASLLSEMRDPAFHSLSCIGFIKSPKFGRYAYLFEPPKWTVPGFVMRSLRDLLCGGLQPSINDRLKVAVTLVETLLQLHTAGWLHKGIRPDNVLFFKDSTEHSTLFDSTFTIYLGGYEYARADNPLEATESPSAHRYSNLYRHPLSLGQGRAAYSKEFDLYSLGCILLELGMWSPLQTVLLRRLRRDLADSATSQAPLSSAIELVPRNDAEYYDMVGTKQTRLQQRGSGSIKAELDFRMGTRYGDLVMSCINAATERKAGDDEDLDDSLVVQDQCLAQLKALVAAV